MSSNRSWNYVTILKLHQSGQIFPSSPPCNKKAPSRSWPCHRRTGRPQICATVPSLFLELPATGCGKSLDRGPCAEWFGRTPAGSVSHLRLVELTECWGLVVNKFVFINWFEILHFYICDCNYIQVDERKQLLEPFLEEDLLAKLSRLALNVLLRRGEVIKSRLDFY